MIYTMKFEFNRKNIFILLGVCFVLLSVISVILFNDSKEVNKKTEAEILQEIEDQIEKDRINENIYLKPTVEDEYHFLVNTYDEKKDIAIWYSEKDFYEFKIKAPDGKVYDITNKQISNYDEENQEVWFTFYDMPPGQWTYTYYSKGIDADITNCGYKYIDNFFMNGEKTISSEGIISFKVNNNDKHLEYSYKIVSLYEDEKGMMIVNDILSGTAKTDEVIEKDISEALKLYDRDTIVVDVEVKINKGLDKFNF